MDAPPEQENKSDGQKLSRIDTFLIEEFKSLRKEIEIRISEYGRMLQISVTSIGVIYAWLGKDGRDNPYLWLGLVGAIFVAALVVVRSIVIHLRLVEIGQYISKTETKFNVTGWEHFLKEKPIRNPIYYSTAAFLVFIFVSTVLVFVIFLFRK